MTTRPPDFDDLVGDEVEGAERDRLRRVHDLLVAAGPPPEVSSPTAPATNVVPLRPRRRRRALLGLAAALGAAAIFTLGLVVAAGDDPSAERVVLTGLQGAQASLEIFALDEAGNWPMLVEVDGLAPAADGALFELWLTKDGAPVALCGSFRTDAEGVAVVPMNAPWKIDDFDGWVVVEAGSTRPLLST